MSRFLMISLMSAAVIGAGADSECSDSMIIASESFKNGEFLDRDYTCDGKDLSPELHWTFSGKAESFAITCEDPDAPGGNFVHWVLYNIPGPLRKLPGGFPKSHAGDGCLHGVNDFGETGYNGPCPPKGKPHRYIFTVYALDSKISDCNLRLTEFKKLIKGHVLGSACITGMYKR